MAILLARVAMIGWLDLVYYPLICRTILKFVFCLFLAEVDCFFCFFEKQRVSFDLSDCTYVGRM
jgi:hypothetical protein